MGQPIEIIHSGTSENLDSIKLNDEVISPENYTVTDGNVGIITLKPEYLGTLNAGTYLLTVNYREGSPVVMTIDILTPGSTNVQIISEGTVGNYTVNSGETVSIHADGNKADLVDVMLNGQMVNSENYVVTEGSTIVTFKNSYLDQLEAGTYEVTLLYSVGRSAESTLAILGEGNSSDESEETTGGVGETAEGTEAPTEAGETTEGTEAPTGEEETTEGTEAPTGADEATEANVSTEVGTNEAPGGDPDTGDMNSAGRWLWLFMVAMVVMTGFATVSNEKKRQK